MENEKKDLSLETEDHCNEQIHSTNNNNRVVLKELHSSNVTSQDTNFLLEMASSYEKVKPNIPDNLLAEWFFEDDILTTKSNMTKSRESVNNNETITTDNQQPMSDTNIASYNVVKSDNMSLLAQNRANESFTYEPMDVDEDIEDYLNYENATALIDEPIYKDKKDQVNNNNNSNNGDNIAKNSIPIENKDTNCLVVTENYSKILEQIDDTKVNEVNNLNSTFATNDLNNEQINILNETANKVQKQDSIFPISEKILDCKQFPKSPNRKENIHIEINSNSFETQKEKSQTLDNFELTPPQQKTDPISSHENEFEKSFDNTSIETAYNNLMSVISIEKDCQLLEESTKIETEEIKDTNLNSTFASNEVSNSFPESVKEQISQSTVFPIKLHVSDCESFPSSPNKNDSIENNSIFPEANNNLATEIIKLIPEENAEPIYNQSEAMKSYCEEKISNNNQQTENNLINFIATERKVFSVGNELSIQTNDVIIDSSKANMEFNSTFCANEFPSDKVMSPFGFPIKNYEPDFEEPSNNKMNSESSQSSEIELNNIKSPESIEVISQQKEQQFSDKSLSEKLPDKISEEKPNIHQQDQVQQSLPQIFLDTSFAENNTEKSLSKECFENTEEQRSNFDMRSPSLSPSVSSKNVLSFSNENISISNVNENNLVQDKNNDNDNIIFAKPLAKKQIFEKFDDRDAENNEFYDNFIAEPYDFDYLLTKGNSCVQVDRNSLLLRFDPLLGAPVPIISNQHNRLENVLHAKQSAKLPRDRELHEKQDTQLKICTPSEISPQNKDIQNMSVDVVCDLGTNEALSSNINNTEDNNNMDNTENQFKNDVTKTDDLEKKLKEAEQREEALIKRITEKEKMLNKVNGVVEAYEKAIAELVAEKGEIVQNYEKQLADVKADRDSNYRHLTSLETTFSDLHVKYEKSKEMTQQLQAGTDILMEEKRKALEDLRLQEQRYLKMKSHAMQQLEIANKQLASLTREHGIELTKLKALLKKEEISRASMNEQLHQKSRENTELMKICDELINGQGSLMK